MPKMTQHDALKNALSDKGYREVQGSTSKYTTMELPGGTGQRFFLGSSGACRVGRIVTKSTPINEVTRQRLLKDGGYVKS